MARDAVDSWRLLAPFARGANVLQGAFLLIVSLLVYVVGLRVFERYELFGLTIFAGALLLLVVLAVISVRRIEIAILVWVVSVSGFRNELILDLPGLPDVTPDRILLVWLIGAVVVNSLARPRRALPPFLPDFLVVAHTLYLLGSCLIENPIAFNMWTRSYLMPAAAYFFGKYLLCDLRWFQRLIYLLVAINLYMGFTSIAQHFGWNALVWPKTILTTEHQFIHRSVGIFVQPAVLGIFIGMVLPFQFYLHFSLRSLVWRWFHLIGILVCLGGLLFTYTRGGWIATIAGFAVMMALGRRVYLNRLAVYSLVAFLLMGTGLLSLKQDAFLQKRLGTENTVEGRINIIVTSYHMWQAHPLFGVGFKRFTDVAADYRTTLDVPHFGLIKANIDKTSSPHDIYISVMAEEGLVGFTIQAWLYVILFLAVLRVRLRSRETDDFFAHYLLPPIGAAMAIYIVGGGTFDYRFFESLNSHFYLFAGVLIAWSRLRGAHVTTLSVEKILR